MSRLRAARCWVGLVFTSVPGNLRDSATATPKGAAEILASSAPLLFDGIASTDALSSPAQGVESPERKED
jgi:hypothetical protein